VIAAQTLIVTQLGLGLGGRLGAGWHDGAERFAGVVTALGVVLAVEKLV
jgi:hypothetical protein